MGVFVYEQRLILVCCHLAANQVIETGIDSCIIPVPIYIGPVSGTSNFVTIRQMCIKLTYVCRISTGDKEAGRLNPSCSIGTYKPKEPVNRAKTKAGSLSGLHKAGAKSSIVKALWDERSNLGNSEDILI